MCVIDEEVGDHVSSCFHLTRLWYHVREAAFTACDQSCGAFYKPNCNVTNMEKVKHIIHAESVKEGRQNQRTPYPEAVLTGVDSSS